MSIEIVIGTQWGDEGKGRIVDLLAAKADIVARFNGGDNAGHTVTVGKQTFKLHLIPSGIVQPRAQCVMGNGMVINPLTFLTESDELQKLGIDVSPHRLFISHAAHLITPAHRLLDQAMDEARGKGAIGTTGRGIGPAYTDRAARRGIRAGETLNPTAFRARVFAHIQEASRELQLLYGKPALDVEAITEEFVEKALRLAPFIQDTGALVRNAVRQGKILLAEAAQGTLLDLDHGSYPYVTSSATTAPGAFTGLGLGVPQHARVVGVTKAFQTRVGAGVFPTELDGDMAVRLRGTGANPWDEFGTTTGRPRRVGWLDGVLLRYTAAINGVTELAITKLDILSGLPILKVCTAYRIDGKEINDLPIGFGTVEFTGEPVYEEFPGWTEDVSGIRKWEELPINAQTYIHKTENISGVPVHLISVGPERDQIIFK